MENGENPFEENRQNFVVCGHQDTSIYYLFNVRMTSCSPAHTLKFFHFLCFDERERERKTEKFRNRSNSEHLYCVFISNFMPISTSIAITSDYLQFSTLFKLSFFSLLAFYIWIEACENIILLSDCIGTCRKSFFLSFSSFRWNPVSLKF